MIVIEQQRQKQVMSICEWAMSAYAASCGDPAALWRQASAMYQTDANVPTRGVYWPTQEETEENPLWMSSSRRDSEAGNETFGYIVWGCGEHKDSSFPLQICSACAPDCCGIGSIADEINGTDCGEVCVDDVALKFSRLSFVVEIIVSANFSAFVSLLMKSLLLSFMAASQSALTSLRTSVQRVNGDELFCLSDSVVFSCGVVPTMNAATGSDERDMQLCPCAVSEWVSPNAPRWRKLWSRPKNEKKLFTAVSCALRQSGAVAQSPVMSAVTNWSLYVISDIIYLYECGFVFCFLIFDLFGFCFCSCFCFCFVDVCERIYLKSILFLLK